MSYLQVQGLHKHFAGKPPTTAIDDLDFSIEEGEFLVLLGPSGCGKTTTLRCLAGLESPTPASSPSATRPVFDAEQADRRCRRTSATSAWCSSRTRCGRT